MVLPAVTRTTSASLKRAAHCRFGLGCKHPLDTESARVINASLISLVSLSRRFRSGNLSNYLFGPDHISYSIWQLNRRSSLREDHHCLLIVGRATPMSVSTKLVALVDEGTWKEASGFPCSPVSIGVFASNDGKGP